MVCLGLPAAVVLWFVLLVVLYDVVYLCYLCGLYGFVVVWVLV